MFFKHFSPPPLIDLLSRMLISQRGDVWCSPVGFAHRGPTHAPVSLFNVDEVVFFFLRVVKLDVED